MHFVYDFLGNLNLFHARVEGDRAYLGEPVNGRSVSPSGAPLAYVRPHLMHIDRQPTDRNHLPAWVKHINSAGPLVKIELETSRGDSIHVELSHERYQDLQLKKDDAVFVSPRDMKIFDLPAS